MIKSVITHETPYIYLLTILILTSRKFKTTSLRAENSLKLIVNYIKPLLFKRDIKLKTRHNQILAKINYLSSCA